MKRSCAPPVSGCARASKRRHIERSVGGGVAVRGVAYTTSEFLRLARISDRAILGLIPSRTSCR
jgi:hypothetical protein